MKDLIQKYVNGEITIEQFVEGFYAYERRYDTIPEISLMLAEDYVRTEDDFKIELRRFL